MYLGNQEKNQETLQVWLKRPASFSFCILFVSILVAVFFRLHAAGRVLVCRFLVAYGRIRHFRF